LLQLFLSYAHQDAALVRQLSTDLRRSDIEPWMDDQLKLAGIWNDEIEERIKGCGFFVPILSHATQEGTDQRFFRREWQLAVEASRPFLPVFLQECQRPASLSNNLAAEIDRHQWAKLFPSYEEGLRRILLFLHEKKRTGIFEESFSCLGPDNPGWRLSGWEIDAADSTGENSRSLHGIARPSTAELLPPTWPRHADKTTRHTAAITIELPDREVILRYRRRLRLSAPLGGDAVFRIAIDGETIDTASLKDPAEDEWTTRSVPVPNRGARRAALEFTVIASYTMNYFPFAEAWIDDVRIA
jgi:hypothetical protein